MLNILKKAALEASKIQLRYFRTNMLGVTNKTDHKNIVTVADKESQNIIQGVLIEGMKKLGVSESDVGFIGEEDAPSESEDLYSAGSHIFIIDPIDGTSNFAAGFDYFCTSIGYVKDGVLHAGLIYRPNTEEMYFADRGKGAQLIRGGKTTKLKIQNRNRKDLMIFTEAWEDFDEPQIKIANRLLPKYRCLRMNGAVALDIVLVAENICGLCITDEGPFIWDLAAAKIILEEAGGGLYDWAGNELILEVSNRHKQYQTLACHPEKKDEIIEVIHHTQMY